MKHAWLIMAHNNYEMLIKLLKFFDHDNNDIFLHIDKKTKWDKSSIEALKFCCKNALLHITKRINVQWGGYSQIRCELLLLKTAASHGKHDYYHLLSGVDVPLKAFSEIDTFFEENYGKEFLRYQQTDYSMESLKKVGVYHFFWNLAGKKKDFVSKGIRFIDNKLACLQIFLGFKRDGFSRLKKGDNWFDVTQSCADFVINHEKDIKGMFRFTFCADEYFMHTLLYLHSDEVGDFNNRLYKSGTDLPRLVDWERGQPYTFRSEDLLCLQNAESDKLFARKFDWQVDSDVVMKMYEYINRM